VYDELLERAEALLRRGEHVVLDASWSDGDARRLARDVAHRTTSDLDEVRCVVPAAIAEARIADRAVAGVDASEATIAVARSMATRFEAWPEAEVVATDAPLEAVADAAASRLHLR
jgi:predicted kinase